MTQEMNTSAQAWGRALASSNPQELYSMFPTIVEDLAEGLKQENHAVLQKLQDLYAKTIKTPSSQQSSTFQQSAVGATKDFVEGLKMASEGFFEFNETKAPPKVISYDEQLNLIQSNFSKGNIPEAMRLFKTLCGMMLHNKLNVDSYADMRLEPSRINQRICNWSSALGMLYRAVK